MRRLLPIALVLFLSACSRPVERGLVVVTKNSTEQTLLGEIIAQHVEKSLKIAVDRLPGTSDTRMAHETVMSGQADIMPQYLCDALTGILRLPPTENQEEIRERLRLEYERRFQCEWTEPLGFHHQFALVVDATRPEFASVRRMSDTSPVRPGWNLGASNDFLTRPDGLGFMMTAYDLRWKAPPVVLEPGLRYRALKSKQLDIVTADSTDSQLLDPGFRRLEDDKHVFISYETAIVGRTDTMNRFPGLREALKALAGKFTDDQMRAMNARVDNERQPVRAVAGDFLKAAGL